MRTLIVDDEPDMRFLMRATLTLEAEIDVAGEAGDGREALAAWERLRPDVIVLDMRMPDQTGLEVARTILTADPTQRVVMCSAYMSDDEVTAATAIGVAACLDKLQIADLPDVVLAAAAP